MTELWINDKKADVEKDTVFSFNSTNTDFSNPTAVKGTYSKTVELPDTDNNRRIFEGSADMRNVWLDFNPKKRTPFLLTSDGYSMSGYCRLDSVSRVRGKITYKVTLMAEIGDFFYNLSYDENGQKRTFDSLYWHFTDSDGKVMTREKEDTSTVIEWNAKYITESWENLYSYDPAKFPRDQKGVITAAPVYGGYADDMDSAKILIDKESLDDSLKDMVSGATEHNGWVVTTAPREYTERETRDYKSWHQRPAVRCSALFDVIADRENNGGYDLVISDTIKESPYYKDTWLILDRLDMEENAKNSEYPFSMERLEHDGHFASTRALALGIDTSGMSDPEAQASFNVSLQLDRNVNNLYTSFVNEVYFPEDRNYMLSTTYGGLSIRLRFETPEGTTYSETVLITSKVGDSDENSSNFGKRYPDALDRLAALIGCSKEDIVVDMRDFIIQNYTLEGEKGSFSVFEEPVRFISKIPKSESLDIYVEMRYVQVSTDGYYHPISKKDGKNNYNPVMATYRLDLFTEDTNGAYTSVPPQLQKVGVSKRQLFSGAMTPYEFITGFARIFNLRFVAESGTVAMMTAEEFYTGEVTDLEGRYDTGQDITIDPIPWRTKWIRYNLETPETMASKIYGTKEYTPYGSISVDTGYNFSNESSDALQGVMFKNAIPYRLSSSWMGEPENLAKPVSLNSPTYTVTVKDGDKEDEQTRPGLMIKTLSPEVYDSHPKLCMFDDGYKSVDAGGVLAFFNHYQPLRGWVSDALRICEEAAGGQCHIYCTGDAYPSESADTKETVAWQFERIPCFSKYLQDESTGVYTHSLDFHKPSRTFLGDAEKYADSASIYARRWAPLISDMYDDNQCKVTLRVLLDGDINGVMRRFYHFGGCMWVISSLRDFRFNSGTPQLVEFIKVRDTKNYTDNLDWGVIPRMMSRPVPEDPDEPDTPTPSVTEYLTLTALEDCSYSIVSSLYDDLECSYSLDGKLWTKLSIGESTPTVQAGTPVLFKREQSPYAISFRSTGRFNASGNAMSMVYGDMFADKTDAPEHCLRQLFSGCVNLVEADRMSLPATTLATSCYASMFYGCSSLIAAPELPATTLAYSCYQSMFYECTSLRVSPVLRAPVLVMNSYLQMFMNCTSLSKITMLATDTDATYCMSNWVYGVPSEGVFVKSAGAELPTASEDNRYKGVPYGWTVETYTE